MQTCAKIIVEKGELQLTASERKDFVDQKRAEIGIETLNSVAIIFLLISIHLVNYIHKYFVDPRAKTPHPVTRIEAALDTLKIRVDPDIPVEKQVQGMCICCDVLCDVHSSCIVLSMLPHSPASDIDICADILKRLPEVLPIKRQEVEGTLTSTY